MQVGENTRPNVLARVRAPLGAPTRACCEPGETLTPSSPSFDPSTAGEDAVAQEVARKLGFDPDDRSSLADLAAVGIARLAWRDGPVEDWHAVPQRRISDSELMRASAAATRSVRDLLVAELPPPPWPRDPAGGEDGADRVFADIADLLSAPSWCLPDGRPIADLAPSGQDLTAFVRHVDKHARCWAGLAAGCDLHEVLLVLACHAALRCRRWWLAPDWPYLISEFARRLDDPGQDSEEAARVRNLRPPGCGRQLRTSRPPRGRTGPAHRRSRLVLPARWPQRPSAGGLRAAGTPGFQASHPRAVAAPSRCPADAPGGQSSDGQGVPR